MTLCKFPTLKLGEFKNLKRLQPSRKFGDAHRPNQESDAMCHCRFRILVRASLPRLGHLTASALRLQSAPLPRGLFSLAGRREAFSSRAVKLHLRFFGAQLIAARTRSPWSGMAEPSKHAERHAIAERFAILSQMLIRRSKLMLQNTKRK